MPIVAIEGPDKCGKTTLFRALKAAFPAVYVDPPSYGAARLHLAAELSLRDLEMWETFYDATELYVSRRHVLVSAEVYSRLYNRPPLRASWLRQHLRVLYIETPVEDLVVRHRMRNEDVQDAKRYHEAVAAYESVVKRYKHRIVKPWHTAEDTLIMLKELTHGC